MFLKKLKNIILKRLEDIKEARILWPPFFVWITRHQTYFTNVGSLEKMETVPIDRNPTVLTTNMAPVKGRLSLFECSMV